MDLPDLRSYHAQDQSIGPIVARPSAKNAKLYRQVCDQISAAIVRGEYPVGKRLPAERELAELYGVSRPTVREGMIALEMQGVIESRHGSGIYVIGLPGEVAPDLDVGAFELAEARRLVEGEAAALATTLIDEDGLAALERALDDMAGPDEVLAMAADREFHLTIARATGNGVLIATVNMYWDMRDRSPLARRIFSRSKSCSMEPRIREHRLIIDAMRRRDPNAARQAMRNHLDRVIDLLLATTETDAVEQAKSEARAQRERMAARAV
ncbi:FadR/GntR family transcriptional regulator [Sphingomonas sp. VNH70]|uniref:FadR/GntR family transcriptional regulator n=1 Tax=Sphingomonas silueang TaxID=3156617 RepID=UPI0032B5C20B